MSVRLLIGMLGLGVAFGALGIFATSKPLQAEVFYFEDFEDLPDGDIDGRKDRWWVYKDGISRYAVGEVQSVSFAHSGQKALGLAAVAYGFFPEMLPVEWRDQTPSMPHGGCIELSWWMYTCYPYADHNRWQVYVTGLSMGGPGSVAMLGNKEILPDTQLDACIDGQWQQFFEFLPTGSWKKVLLQVDFTQTPDRYRFRLDSEGRPGVWHPDSDNHSQWYSFHSDPAGFDAEYFGAIGFANESIHDNFWPPPNFFIDDFQARVVPEPGTLLLLLVCGGLGSLAYLRRTTEAR